MGDIIIAAIIAICTYTGFKRGFVRAAFGAVSSIVASIAAFALYTPIGHMVENSDVGNTIKVKLAASFSQNAAQPITTFAAESAADIAVRVLCFVAAAMLIKIVIAAFGRVLCSAAKLPLIKQADGALGAVIGLFGGVIICYILIAASAAFTQDSAYTAIFAAINKSYLSALFYNTDFFTNILLK